MLLMQFSARSTDFPAITEWPEQDVRAHVAFMQATNRELTASGELLHAQGLAMPDTTRIVRAGADGRPRITEGPFPETKEFLAGYWITDCAGPERAAEIAARISAAPGPGGRPLNMPIEVREVFAVPPAEQGH
ncbi:YciI family protein [Kitasatospora sp. NPDC052896]|uniref:YciI family protein n=1 Tax=Kitasatospora sp. NPDC052896 TaxID=3364061 RepID=UPI0037CB14C8